MDFHGLLPTTILVATSLAFLCTKRSILFVQLLNSKVVAVISQMINRLIFLGEPIYGLL
jgi:hypothetical protein